MSFDILSTVNPIGSMKTWGKSSCTLYMKQRIEIIDNSRRRYSRIIIACLEVYVASRHIPRFNRFTQHWWSSDRWKSREFPIFQNRPKRKTVSSWSNKFWKRRRSQPLRGYFYCKITSYFLLILKYYILMESNWYLTADLGWNTTTHKIWACNRVAEVGK